jgi:glycerol-3-phosphate dehydrogenase
VLLGAPQILDHDAAGADGAMTVIGVKYTTARGVGDKVADVALRRLGRGVRARHGRLGALPGAGIADHEALAIETARATGLEVAPPIVRHLTTLYGDRCAAIVRLMAERTDWRMPLVAGRPHVGAEVVHAVRQEMAATLADIVIRRMELGAMEYPGTAIVEAAAAIAADELKWDAARRVREVNAVSALYAPR